MADLVPRPEGIERISGAFSCQAVRWFPLRKAFLPPVFKGPLVPGRKPASECMLAAHAMAIARMAKRQPSMGLPAPVYRDRVDS
jgi:hypothetical protein